MKIEKFKDFKGGWFIGNFSPTSHRTPDFEICYKVHKKGEKWPKHYHKQSVEINLLMHGKMIIQGKELVPGDIFTLDKLEVADPEFLEDCELIVVKIPSVMGDKYEVAPE